MDTERISMLLFPICIQELKLGKAKVWCSKLNPGFPYKCSRTKTLHRQLLPPRMCSNKKLGSEAELGPNLGTVTREDRVPNSNFITVLTAFTMSYSLVWMLTLLIYLVYDNSLTFTGRVCVVLSLYAVFH